MYIVARVIAAVKHKEKIDRKCRILYHEYGAATDGRRLSHSLERGGLCMVELLLAILLVVAITEAVKYIKK